MVAREKEETFVGGKGCSQLHQTKRKRRRKQLIHSTPSIKKHTVNDAEGARKRERERVGGQSVNRNEILSQTREVRGIRKHSSSRSRSGSKGCDSVRSNKRTERRTQARKAAVNCLTGSK